MVGHPDTFQEQSNLSVKYEIKSLSAFTTSLRCNKILSIIQNRTLEIILFNIFLIIEVETKQFICRDLFLDLVKVRKHGIQYGLFKL